MSGKIKRIAMWSGPRNLSTAMMYSFAARTDTVVVDEPFYGVYLKETELNHPMREEILANMTLSEDEVIGAMLANIEKPIFYQKHMTHHLLPHMRRDWIKSLTNVLLIRHPARVMASYGVKRESFTIDDLGFLQQGELFDMLKKDGQSPIVIDSHDIVSDPPDALRKLCATLEIPFDEDMLSWARGGIAADGVWAPHWYGAVHNSTGFSKAEDDLPIVNQEHREIFDQCLDIYERLKVNAL